jgi:hypothetical protein
MRKHPDLRHEQPAGVALRVALRVGLGRVWVGLGRVVHLLSYKSYKSYWSGVGELVDQFPTNSPIRNPSQSLAIHSKETQKTYVFSLLIYP